MSIALFALQEIGKFRILLELRASALEGRPATAKEIRQTYENHHQKQRRGQGGVRLVARAGTELAKLLNRARDSGNLNSEAGLQVDYIIAKKMRSLPAQRSESRERGFYVDLDEANYDWNRPGHFRLQESYQYIAEAVSAYAVVRHNFSLETLEYTVPELGSAVAAWTDRPELPEPKWPKPPIPPTR